VEQWKNMNGDTYGEKIEIKSKAGMADRQRDREIRIVWEEKNGTCFFDGAARVARFFCSTNQNEI
jgi:hypothetical protein